MKLYGHALSSCTRKVLMVLAEKGVEADLFLVDLFAHEQKRDAYLALQPFAVVPVLDDDGFVIYESRAMMRYLDARFDGALLTPNSIQERARMDQWLSVDQSYVAPHTRTLALERIVKKREGIAIDQKAVDGAELALGRAFHVIERALEPDRYLAGAAFSLADASLMPYVASLPMIGAEHLLHGLPRLGSWWSRVQERASWKRALAADFMRDASAAG